MTPEGLRASEEQGRSAELSAGLPGQDSAITRVAAWSDIFSILQPAHLSAGRVVDARFAIIVEPAFFLITGRRISSTNHTREHRSLVQMSQYYILSPVTHKYLSRIAIREIAMGTASSYGISISAKCLHHSAAYQ